MLTPMALARWRQQHGRWCPYDNRYGDWEARAFVGHGNLGALVFVHMDPVAAVAGYTVDEVGPAGIAAGVDRMDSPVAD